MPIGSYSLVPHVAHALWQYRPQRVLDLGIGFGMYGAVVREWLDAGMRPWRTHLTGVEAFAKYGNPLWDLYDLVVVDSVQNYLMRSTDRFDFILLSDVIEHFERSDGLGVIQQCCSRLNPNGHLVVGTPAIFMAQDAVAGNEYERHRSLWTASDFAALGGTVIKDGSRDEFGHQMLLAEFAASG